MDGAFDLEFDGGGDFVGSGGWEGQYQLAIRAGSHRQLLAAGEHFCGHNFALQGGYNEFAVARPIEDVQVKRAAILSDFLRATTPTQLIREWAGGGAVDGVAVHFHPGADFFQALDGGGRGLAKCGGRLSSVRLSPPCGPIVPAPGPVRGPPGFRDGW